MYRDELLDHYRHPRNWGLLPTADLSGERFNPLCGDQVTVTGQLDGDVLRKLTFEGRGCVISLAAASLLTQAVTGKLLSDIATLDATFMQQLLGVQLGPTRLKCALLPLEALKKGISNVGSLQTSERSTSAD